MMTKNNKRVDMYLVPKTYVFNKDFQKQVLYLFLKESQKREQGFLSADEISQCLGISRKEFENCYQELLDEKKIKLTNNGLEVLSYH